MNLPARPIQHHESRATCALSSDDAGIAADLRPRGIASATEARRPSGRRSPADLDALSLSGTALLTQELGSTPNVRANLI
jgi:hypothetical protein